MNSQLNPGDPLYYVRAADTRRGTVTSRTDPPETRGMAPMADRNRALTQTAMWIRDGGALGCVRRSSFAN